MANNETMSNDEIQKLLEQMSGAKPQAAAPEVKKAEPPVSAANSSFSQNDIEALINAAASQNAEPAPAEVQGAVFFPSGGLLSGADESKIPGPDEIKNVTAVEKTSEMPDFAEIPEPPREAPAVPAETEFIETRSQDEVMDEASGQRNHVNVSDVLSANDDITSANSAKSEIANINAGGNIQIDNLSAEAEVLKQVDVNGSEIIAAQLAVQNFGEETSVFSSNEPKITEKPFGQSIPNNFENTVKSAEENIINNSIQPDAPIESAESIAPPAQQNFGEEISVASSDGPKIAEESSEQSIPNNFESTVKSAEENVINDAIQPDAAVESAESITPPAVQDAALNVSSSVAGGSSSFFDILSNAQGSSEVKNGSKIFDIADEVINLNDQQMSSALTQAESNFSSQLFKKDQEINELQAAVDSLLAENNDTVIRLTAAEEELNIARAKITGLEAEISNFKNNQAVSISEAKVNDAASGAASDNGEEIKLLNKKISELNDELSTKDASILRLEEKLSGFETESNDNKKEISRLQNEIELIKTENEKLASELNEKSEKIKELTDAFEGLTEKSEAAKDEEGPGAEKLNSVDGIKEKFQKLMQERDQAIELLNKFEVEAKKAKIELEHLKESYKSAVEERDNSMNELKEKNSEIDKIYSTMAKYKEDSGFMKREIKTLKDEKEHIVEELNQKIKELEENSKQLSERLDEKENEFNAREEAFKNELTQKENEFLFEKEAANSEIKELTRRIEVINQQMNASYAESNNFHENLEQIYSQLCDADQSLREDAAEETSGQVEPKAIFIIEKSGSEFSEKSPEMIFECLNALEIKYETMTYDEYISCENNPASSALCVFAAVENKSVIPKVYEAALASKKVPFVIYGDGLPVADYDVLSMFVSGTVSDYIDFKTNKEIIETIIKRNFESRIALIGKMVTVKDQNELKLRESVALSIETRVKSNKIESLTGQLDYLRQSNKKMRSAINELEFVFENILGIVSNLSAQELPESIAEKFNSITDILIKASEKKI